MTTNSQTTQSSSFKQHVVSGVKRLQPYKPGKPTDELARELGLDEASIVKLASNENPLGPSERVRTALVNELDQTSRYPDGNGFVLKQVLAQRLGVDVGQITLGNGSSDLLDFITRVFVNDGDEVVMSQHAFAVYGLVASVVGATCVTVPAKNYGHDLTAMAKAITDKTRVVFVTNPNNPTGTWNTRDELSDFLKAVPSSVMVLLDEAYFEYVDEPDYPSGTEFLNDHPNVVVTRTFSKAYGLASLRVGYGISSLEVADLLNRVRPPFNVNSYAQAAAVAAIQDTDYVARSVVMNQQGMHMLTQAFAELSLAFIPSVANFITFELPASHNASDVYQALLQHGVIVRPVASYDLPNYLRVSIGTPEENTRFIDALKACLQA